MADTLDSQAEAFAQLLKLSGDPDAAFRSAVALANGLFPHQIEGVAFLLGRRRAILADDMGLGKTRQSIVSLRHLTPERTPPRCLSSLGQAKLGARDRHRRGGCFCPGHRRNGPVSPDRRMDRHQLRHPGTARREPPACAVGGAGVRRSALPEEPHQRAEQARAPADGRGCGGNARARRAAPDRNAAHQPASRSLRAAAAGRPSARPQLSRVRETLLRRRERESTAGRREEPRTSRS